MRRLFSVCYTSHGEVLCRKEEDYEMLISRIGHTALKTDSKILAYSVMSTHVHLVLATDDLSRFVSDLRTSYTRSFNRIYKRKGRLGEHRFYSIPLLGHRHILAAISYVLRNPVHHQVAVNPFSYPYSSLTLYFNPKARRDCLKNEIHRSGTCKHVGNKRKAVCRKSHRLVNRHSHFEEDIVFKENGAIHPFCFVETGIVENFYGSYNALHFHLIRRDFQNWEKEQKEEDIDSESVSLKNMEPFLDDEAIAALERESRRKNEEMLLTDILLCDFIDSSVVRDTMKKESYVELDRQERERARHLCRRRFKIPIGAHQLNRCLGEKDLAAFAKKTGKMAKEDANSDISRE